jgi:predicted nucleotide-binding protein
VERERKIELLQAQVEAANGGDPTDFDLWRNQTEMVFRTTMGVEHPLHQAFKAVDYSPSVWTSGTDFRPYRVRGVKEGISLLTTAMQEVELTSPTGDTTSAVVHRELGEDVFIVHGHDSVAKLDTARVLEGLLGFAPVILHEKANVGRVLIEKLEGEAGTVGFAVVLLTADDLGRAKAAGDDQTRARQNVVFELGFFIGLIGRPRVVALYEPGVELPSDLSGLVYLELDPRGGWKKDLARELDAAGFTVTWSALGRL